MITIKFYNAEGHYQGWCKATKGRHGEVKSWLKGGGKVTIGGKPCEAYGLMSKLIDAHYDNIEQSKSRRLKCQ